MSRRGLGWALVGLWVGSGCAAPPAPAPLIPVPDNHHEVIATVDGGILATYIGSRRALKACLQAAPGSDTSQWVAALAVDQPPAVDTARRPPDTRLRGTLCFEHPLPASLPQGLHALHLDLHDTYRDTTVPTQSLRFQYEPDAPGRRELRRTWLGLARQIGGDDTDPQLLEELQATADQARTEGWLLTQARAAATLAYGLRRRADADAWLQARRWAEPDWGWLSDPAAAAARGELAYEAAALALQTGDGVRAWWQLQRAERAYEAVADPRLLTVGMKQAEVMARAGARREAILHLRASLDECDESACSSSLVRSAGTTLAWWVATDPLADGEQLSWAQALAQRSAGIESNAVGTLERAAEQINLGFLALRLGQQPAPWIDQAEQWLLGHDASPSRRRRTLLAWVELARAEQDRLRRAVELVDRRLAELPPFEDTEAAAWRAGIHARALASLGRIGEAQARIDRALELHRQAEQATPFADRRDVSADRATEDRLFAVRLALDRGDADGAWDQLRQLDARVVRSRRQPAIDPEQRRYLQSLDQLEAPASAAREQQRAHQHRAVRTRLATLPKERSGDGPAAAPIDFRIVPTEEELFVLRHQADAGATLYRRVAVDRGQLDRWVRELDGLMQAEAATDAVWRKAAAPLAQAVLPQLSDLSSRTALGLHGLAQRIPWSALPVGDEGWLFQHTEVVVVPVGAVTLQRSATPPQAGLMVVDPALDLPGARKNAARYQTLLPQAEVLLGARATRRAVETALASAGFLHVDAHLQEDPVFPELSGVLLDLGLWRPVPALEQLPTPLSWINMSSCRSATASASASRGSFGLAGWLADGHAAWVVGAQADLWDRAAGRFNAAFYEAAAQGASVPAAFNRGLESVAAELPAPRWAPLVLLSTSAEEVRRGS